MLQNAILEFDNFRLVKTVSSSRSIRTYICTSLALISLHQLSALLRPFPPASPSSPLGGSIVPLKGTLNLWARARWSYCQTSPAEVNSCQPHTFLSIPWLVSHQPSFILLHTLLIFDTDTTDTTSSGQGIVETLDPMLMDVLKELPNADGWVFGESHVDVFLN